MVIQQLPEGLRDAVCVFYLVLRALDTVEDDMALDPDVKVPLLRCFHEKSYDRCGRLAAARRRSASFPLARRLQDAGTRLWRLGLGQAPRRRAAPAAVFF